MGANDCHICKLSCEMTLIVQYICCQACMIAFADVEWGVKWSLYCCNKGCSHEPTLA